MKINIIFWKKVPYALYYR